MNIKLLSNQEMPGFFKGAGVAFCEENLYATGTDASSLMVMDKRWKVQQTINVHASEAIKAPAGQQAPYNAIAIVPVDKMPFLLMLRPEAAANAPYKALLVNLDKETTEELDLSVFYNRLKTAGFDAPHIAAATVMDDKLILCSKEKKEHGDNQFIITSTSFWNNQHAAELTPVKLEFEQRPGLALTVQGLTYSYKNDWLIFSAYGDSQQQAGKDGLSGESHIGVIENASRKIGRKRIKPNALINLTDVSDKFTHQQAASICVLTDKAEKLKLHMVSESLNGEISFFKIRLKE